MNFYTNLSTLIFPKMKEKNNEGNIGHEILKEGETIYIDEVPYVRVSVRLSGLGDVNTGQYIDSLENENLVLKTEKEKLESKVAQFENIIGKHQILNRNLIAELHSLKDSFNRNFEYQVKKTIEKQQEHIEFLQKKIAERKTVIRELKREKISLLKPEDEKSDNAPSKLEVKSTKLLNQIANLKRSIDSFHQYMNENNSGNKKLDTLIKQFQKLNCELSRTVQKYESKRLSEENTLSAIKIIPLKK